ncbi:Lipoprotein LprI [Mycobacterium simulans]|uniref:Lipoprotein LprI n=1 Tax=Mycobacterium simulans TaxID=627089 RepID=A0A7Z7N9R8_9MYCO|nr:MliC family protein [Mycobacterium simulans]SOJ54961.1 Lipoprotein LprI [Mycobacterium simulans]
MRLIAAVLATLILSACSSKATPPAPSSHPGTTASSAAAPAAGSTLDCAKPTNAAQELVCTDPKLVELDHRLQTAYQQALDRAGADKAALTASQNSWAATRDQCAQNVDMPTCVLEAYQTRLVQLAIADPATAAPPVITYRCPANRGALTAQFYNQFDPKAAVVNWKGEQYILFVQLSGSGARYGRQGIEYWEHQGEVRLDFSGVSQGAKFVCQTS